MFPSDQSTIIEQAKFTYSPLGKAFKKQINTIEEQVKNSWSFRSFKTLFPKIDN